VTGRGQRAPAPARVVIVTPELWGYTRENGGISTSVFHFARLFRSRGDRVTCVVGLAKPVEPDPVWARRYADAGVEVRAAVAGRPPRPLDRAPYACEFPFRAIAEAVADAVPRDADVVYLQDWAGLGFELLRRRTLRSGSPPPVVVTILRGSSGWAGMGESTDGAGLERAESFAVERSDLVVSPSRSYRDFAEAHGVRLPGDGRTRVLGHPWLPLGDGPALPSERAERFRRVVFFGRLEPRKGFDLFVEAWRLLAGRRPELLAGLEQVVFLGREGVHDGELEIVLEELSSLGPEAVHVGGLDSWAANDYLAANATDALVVVPSLRENFPNAVVEATLVPGLNVICSDVGGIGEIVGARGAAQLFAPTVPALAAALETSLDHGPKPADELASYDWRTANARWLSFHESVVSRPRRRAPRRHRAATRLSVVVTTFEWPEALDVLLEALWAQSDDRFEIVVADDGSGSATKAIVERWRGVFGKRLAHAWQPDEGYRIARARNLGAIASSGDFLVFLDGDCLPGRDFVRALKTSALPGWFVSTRRVGLSQELSRRILAREVEAHRWSRLRWTVRARRELDGIAPLTPRDRRRTGRAKLPEFEPPDRAYGSGFGVSRADFERVNGFDLRFTGWGEEDVDLAVRLRRLGLRCGHAGPRATLFHLWHPSRMEHGRPNWWLLKDTEARSHVEADVGLRELAAEPAAGQSSANRVGASSSSREPVNR
jgi:glycosyltransferase involved in cell wall biosynthesis/GT2 family glycosyltransferase